MSAPSRARYCTCSGPSGPDHWDAKGKFRLAVLGLSHFEITGAGQLQQAAFDLQGTISREDGHWTYDLKAKLAGLRAELLEPFNPQWAQKLQGLSPVAADLALKGTGLAWPPEQFDWTLDTTAFRDQRVSVEQLKITLAGNPREQNLQGDGPGQFRRISLTAAGPLLSSGKGDLKLQTKNLQPARLGLEKAGATALNGKFSGTFSLARAPWPWPGSGCPATWRPGAAWTRSRCRICGPGLPGSTRSWK